MNEVSSFLSIHWLDMLGTVVGLVYIYQEYKASIWLWLTGIIMPAIYVYVYWHAGLYADFGMNIYYVLAAVYGLLVWTFGHKRGQEEEHQLPITHVKRSLLLPSALLFAILWGGIYYVLITFTNSTVPVLDSFGNSLSIIGMWWLARKYVEQWWLWIVIDTELSALYFYKGLPFTSGLYALYVVIAVAGYFKWKRLMKTQ